MKLTKIGFLLAIIFVLNSCASSYKMINPKGLNYLSNDLKEGVSLDYKYDLLNKKYAKKEIKKGVKVVAIKITNNSERDLVFGKDLKLAFDNDKELYIMENDKVFKSLKQNTASYLLYLLLTSINLTVTTINNNRVETSTTPIGLIIGPGLASGNMLAASSANNKFKSELLEFDIVGKTIKKGETKSGLIGIKSDSYEALKIKLNN